MNVSSTLDNITLNNLTLPGSLGNYILVIFTLGNPTLAPGTLVLRHKYRMFSLKTYTSKLFYTGSVCSVLDTFHI